MMSTIPPVKTIIYTPAFASFGNLLYHTFFINQSSPGFLCSYRVADFEFTPECIVFDLLNIGLYHGWLVDPQEAEETKAVSKLSYNQLVEKIILTKQQPDNSQQVSEGRHDSKLQN